ncbi:eukaryotic translation initiation factor 2D isoform X3 [Echeneis naucrates]|uniref:eukaryotic translation initiation factor 2D isoform X3 n=1 Tax=Echeneis naucrates TaxID=173247 RepID=UPI00111402E8|nr:eukaryotic translation initiation factor 2D isoform X3 [Echeneis naucrates]
MFSKSFRVKSNTVIKGSDRRKLKADVSAAFASLSADELSELIPNKEEINVVKIYAHKGEAVTLYVLHKNPLFFELEKRLYPTVYVLWRYPALLPTFKTWPPVLQKLIGGADLMLPGVVVPSTGLPQVKRGDCCAVTLVNNGASVAVGTAALSSEEMQSSGMKGRGVCVLHTYMDNLCPSGKQLDIKKSSYKKLSKFLQAMQQQHNLVQVKELTKGVESIVEVDWKNPQLRSFIVPEETGGEAVPAQGGGEGEAPYHPPEISTLYCVSARVEPLFLEANKRKGAIVQPAEVRSIVTEYVKKNELVDENNKNYVSINTTLCDCLLEKSEYQEVEFLKWDDLFSRTLGKMQECYQIVFPGQTAIIKKGHIEPIDISVASRGSNKKVTLIKNLEVYCLDPAVVATALQHRVQASSVLQPIPGAKDKVLVQIQGNQIHQVGSLLLDHYRIPRKYIQGLEKAVKGGKKK